MTDAYFRHDKYDILNNNVFLMSLKSKVDLLKNKNLPFRALFAKIFQHLKNRNNNSKLPHNKKKQNYLLQSSLTALFPLNLKSISVTLRSRT